ncbi:MAG: membrane-anchored protein YejM (alkaline phosphatase superfamily) [Planctomycetota bacterium]|jgi:membrane-anchored protein YejM (alkaline phosphatase superfamily)
MPSRHRSPSPNVLPSSSSLRHAAFQLWLLNVVVGTVVGSLWLFRIPDDLSIGLRLYVSVALISKVAVLGMLPAALFGAVHFLSQRRQKKRVAAGKKTFPSWVIGLTQALLGGIFLELLYTDTAIHKLLSYHANGAVLNVAMTEGSGDAVHLESRIFITASAVLAALTLVQFLFWRWRLSSCRVREAQGRRQPLLLQPRVVLLAGLLPLIGIDQSVHAMASLNGDHELLFVTRPLPGPKLRLPRLRELLGEVQPDPEMMPERARLSYPGAMPQLPPDGPRPNILVVVLDSWRRDAFSAETSPRLHAFSAGARVFEDHVSGGNGTRYGLFSLLYGLHGSYWFRVLEEQRTPVLLDVLQEEGYDTRVWSAASMNFPEFRMTAWAGLPKGNVIDRFVNERGEPLSQRSDEKDVFVGEAFEEWLGERKATDSEQPFFGFVLLDSPHQPYFNPGGPNQPALENDLSYLELCLTATEGPELVALQERMTNSYKNSILHADQVAGDILDALEAAGELENTIVVVTGDHGEEFFENLAWGHTSNFSPEQINVPFYMRGPGITTGVESGATSHLDLSNSLLELLGADPELRAGYSLGESLFDPVPDRRRVVGAWAHLGILTPSGILCLPLKVGDDEIWVYNNSWQPMLKDATERLEAEREVLQRTAAECLRFLSVE